jgi:hypothetical protein
VRERERREEEDKIAVWGGRGKGRQREFMDLRQSDRPLRQIAYYIHYRKIYYKYKIYTMYGPA